MARKRRRDKCRQRARKRRPRDVGAVVVCPRGGRDCPCRRSGMNPAPPSKPTHVVPLVALLEGLPSCLCDATASESHQLYVRQFGQLVSLIRRRTAFYAVPSNTREETRQKLEFFKAVIENEGGHRLFYVHGEPVRSEKDVQILFRLVWHGSPSDVSREVDDGRGPADYKVSRGATDKTIVEFKLASNPRLRRNLRKQVETYKKASDAAAGFKVVIFFTEAEWLRVMATLEELGLLSSRDIILVDARQDNKPSGSRA